jgi:hypothetical protein
LLLGASVTCEEASLLKTSGMMVEPELGGSPCATLHSFISAMILGPWNMFAVTYFLYSPDLAPYEVFFL